MTQGLFNRRSLGLGGLLAVLVAGLAASPALAKSTAPAKLTGSSVDTSMCSIPQVAQPFLSASDTNWYTLAAGQTPGNFNGAGWTLTGGAKIITTPLADGQSGQVLDLPAGSQAVSPNICVSTDYPTARTMVQNAAGTEIAYAVAYAGTKSWNKPKPAGQISGPGNGWSLSDSFQVHPGDLAGWQIVQFTFAASAGDNGNSDAEMYNFYIDPRMGR